jgi:hypothetical protein
VYQRKKALMRRPGMVFQRLRLLLAVLVMVTQAPDRVRSASSGGTVSGNQVDSKDEATCTFDCIFWNLYCYCFQGE